MNVLKILNRNKYKMDGSPIEKERISLEWWNVRKNLGDYLAYVVYNWMLDKKNINPDKQVKKTVHILTIGSVIGIGSFDAVIWGSGLHTLGSIHAISQRYKFVKYDIRALRGPITAAVMKEFGYSVENVSLGDPAVILPFIYPKEKSEKIYPYSIINHFTAKTKGDGHYINIETYDYEFFIDEICKSSLIVSSSLHGIILAESYGVPAIFLNDGRNKELIKYYDWYFSTGRMNVKIANSVEEALKMEPMPLPDLKLMRKELIATFPYDLFEV
ncbi:MAG: polysaccharide pyruvyl transferase family protein [Oscillospiraceae bacterium]